MSNNQTTSVRLRQLEAVADSHLEHIARIDVLTRKLDELLILFGESLEAHFHEDTYTRVERARFYQKQLALIENIS